MHCRVCGGSSSPTPCELGRWEAETEARGMRREAGGGDPMILSLYALYFGSFCGILTLFIGQWTRYGVAAVHDNRNGYCSL